ncbi:hypothetical protein ABIA00_000169 [Bradyrhizobium ottawaense]|jgi:hypothetical protein|nr:hypothetical protein [Bradyrhizobium elkanii]MCS4113074.1 hypothetical protein [Bradyrhizobium elkanii]OIM95443.1 hypothetical protein BLN97_05145 [Bradyrhizobium elkanii]
MYFRSILVFVLLISSSAAIAQSRKGSDPIIICPTAKIARCDVLVDPMGNPAQPVRCPASHCRASATIRDGKKVCNFSCPEYFDIFN